MSNDLIKQLKNARKRLLKAVKKLPEDEKILGEWTKKEILAHIAGWYEDGVDGTQKILRGEKLNSFRMSVNRYNRLSLEKRKNKTVRQIINEMNKLHDIWIKQINALDEEQITGFYGTILRKKPINILWLINEAISHDNNHANEIERKYQ